MNNEEKQLIRQSAWTKDLRNQLYRRANIRNRQHILDIGCGTGIITNELREKSGNSVTGVDNNEKRIKQAAETYPGIDFITADALNLPFEDNSFDMIVTSFLWLWIKNRPMLAKEIKRLLKPGGVYISLTELDYEARLDYPEPLEQKKYLYINILKEMGGDPFVARKLKALFADDNLNTTAGAFCPMFDDKQLLEDFEKDREYICNDLKTFPLITQEKAEELFNIEITAIKNKTRFIFMPVFWLYVVKAY